MQIIFILSVSLQDAALLAGQGCAFAHLALLSQYACLTLFLSPNCHYLYGLHGVFDYKVEHVLSFACSTSLVGRLPDLFRALLRIRAY